MTLHEEMLEIYNRLSVQARWPRPEDMELFVAKVREHDAKKSPQTILKYYKLSEAITRQDECAKAIERVLAAVKEELTDIAGSIEVNGKRLDIIALMDALHAVDKAIKGVGDES